jgi:hypothetical protein
MLMNDNYMFKMTIYRFEYDIGEYWLRCDIESSITDLLLQQDQIQ